MWITFLIVIQKVINLSRRNELSESLIQLLRFSHSQKRENGTFARHDFFLLTLTAQQQFL